MKTYTINSFRRGPAFLVMIGVFLACAGILIAVAIVLDPSVIGFASWMIGCTLLGVYVVRSAMRIAVQNMVVLLDNESVTLRSAAERTIPLKQVVSYQCYEYGESILFTLRLQQGKALTLIHNKLFCPADDFQALIADFENQHTVIAARETQPHRIQREKGFFEKPFANALGWGIVVLLVGFTLYLLVYGIKPGKMASVLMVYGTSLGHLGPWLAARRKKPEDQ